MNELQLNMTKFQIGTKTGHRAQEHIFVLKSMIDLNNMLNRPTILSLFDIKKFFDSENLIDVLGEAYRCGVKGKMYRLLYEMNKETTIKVKTPVGTSEEASVGAGLGQGTMESAVLSAVSLDKGVNDAFEDSENEMHYGEVRLQPLLFQK